MAAMGGTMHMLIHNSDINRVTFEIFQPANLSAVQVLSVDTIIGTYLSPLITDGVTMFANLPGGIYNFDTTPAIAIDTSRAKDRNNMQTLFQNYLYFKNKRSLMKYDGTDITSVGYDLEDGLPADKIGEITAMTSSWKYTFAAVQGATYSHILAMDRSHKWHYYARVPTAGLWIRELFLSDAPDAIDRLWCIFGNYAFPGYFLNPMVNPLQAGTYSFVPTGHFTTPIYGGDLPEEPGAFYDININADAMGGGNFIQHYYGLNGAVSTLSLGQVSSISQSLLYGSPYGLEGQRIQARFMIAGSASGTTPVFRNAIMHYLKKPDLREAFGFEIDLEETARSNQRSREAIIGSLTYETNIKTLMPFHYGQIATKNVMIVAAPGNEMTEKEKEFAPEREGFVRLQVTEIL